MTDHPTAHDVTVVGVDGSPCSLRAFEWALRSAAQGGGCLEVVYVRNPVSRDDPLTPAAAETVVHSLVDRARASGVVASGAIEVGVPGQVLVGRSIDAAQLVLGATGHRSRGGLLLGEVAQHCARYALSPVILVPAYNWSSTDTQANERYGSPGARKDQGPFGAGLSPASAAS